MSLSDETRKAIADAWVEAPQLAFDGDTDEFVAWVESVLAPLLTAELQAENERLTVERDTARASVDRGEAVHRQTMRVWATEVAWVESVVGPLTIAGERLRDERDEARAECSALRQELLAAKNWNPDTWQEHVAEVARLRTALSEPTDEFIDRVAHIRHDREQYISATSWEARPEDQREQWRQSVRNTLTVVAAALAPVRETEGQ